MENQNQQNRINLITLGESGVGKTTLINRYVNQDFKLDDKSTIGIEWKKKQVLVDNQSYNVLILDTGGQERYDSITRTYFKNADGVLLMFDLTNEKTFFKVLKWFDEIKEKSPEYAQIIIIGTKSDLVTETNEYHDFVTKVNLFAKQKNIAFIQTSSKLNLQIDESFLTILKLIIAQKFWNDKGRQEQQQQFGGTIIKLTKDKILQIKENVTKC